MIDLTPILQPILTVLGTVITGLLVIYVPRAISAFEARTGIQLTDQQRAIVLGSIQTAVGKIETKLDQGILTAADIHVGNPTIIAESASAIDAVPDASAALGMTVNGTARMVTGEVDLAAHPGPARLVPGMQSAMVPS